MWGLVQPWDHTFKADMVKIHKLKDPFGENKCRRRQDSALYKQTNKQTLLPIFNTAGCVAAA